MLQIGVLGPFLFRNRGRDIKLPRKAQGLFAYLASQNGQPVSRERLAYLLWPDHPDAQSRHGVRNCLFDIRRAAGRGIERLLKSDGQRVVLEIADLDFDLVAFEDASKSESLSALSEAAGLYRGEFLSDLRVAAEPFEDWLTEQRE